MAIYTLLAIFFLIFDRLFKIMAIKGWLEAPVSLLGKMFRLKFIPNYNIAFSIPFRGAWLIILILAIILLLFYYLFYYLRKKDYESFGVIFTVLLGAVSNLFDRVKYGYVIDYLDLKYFTVFNLADVMIVASVFIFYFIYIKNKKAQP